MRGRVFTQPGSFPDLGAAENDVRFTLTNRHRWAGTSRPFRTNGLNRSRGRALRLAAEPSG
jgi:hypothetical protein